MKASPVPADDVEVAYQRAGELHRFLAPAAAEQIEIGPQRASEESHAADDDFVALEDMHIRVPRLALELIDQFEVVSVELMVAENVEHRLAEGVESPA